MELSFPEGRAAGRALDVIKTIQVGLGLEQKMLPENVMHNLVSNVSIKIEKYATKRKQPLCWEWLRNCLSKSLSSCMQFTVGSTLYIYVLYR